MQNYFKTTFSTGEFAKIFNINKDTLLYYDKINLFKPAGVHSNGYRYYTFDQFEKFFAIHILRTIDLPINQVKEYFEAPNLTDFQQLMLEQQKIVANKIQELQNIQFFLHRTLAITKELEDVTIGEVFIKELPEESVIYSENQLSWDDSDTEEFSATNIFYEKQGIQGSASCGSVYLKEELPSALEEGKHYFFASVNGPSSKKKPAGNYAIIYHQDIYGDIEQAYDKLMSYLETNQLEIDSDIFEEYLLHSIITIKEEEFITKISVRVKEK